MSVRAGTRLTALAAVPLLLLGPVPAAPAPGGPAPTAAAASAPYRIGYVSGGATSIGAVDAVTGRPVTPPTGTGRGEEPSARAGAVVFVRHRAQHVDGDLAYLPPGAPIPATLTRDDFADRHPSLSPDGQSVAFESDRAGQPDIWVIRVDGTGLRRVTDHPAPDSWPTWSPSGDRIAFSSTRADPAGSVFVVPAAGGTPIRLATGTQPAWSPVADRIAFTTSAGDLTLIAGGGGTPTRVTIGEEAAWSPDGARLAYVTRDADPAGDLFTVSAGGPGGPPTRLVATPGHGATNPTWRLNIILFTDIADGEDGTDVWSADARGRDRRDLTQRPDLDETGPAFSPDGARIAYSESDGDGAARIVVADADGGLPTAVTTYVSSRRDRDPTWSPDGTMLAFTRVVDRGEDVDRTVLVARVADGTVLGTIPMPAHLVGDAYEPAWSPDGTHLAIVRRAAVRPAVPVTPRSVDRPTYPGGSFTVEQAISTPVIPPKPDIVFLVDTTASMEGTIAAIRRNIGTIVGRIHEDEPTAQFALVGYRSREDTAAPYAAGYFLAMPLQAINPADPENPLAVALRTFVTGGGAVQEDFLYPLHQITGAGGIAFRSDSSRVVVLIGDAPSDEGRYRLVSPPSATPDVLPEILAARVQVVAAPINTSAGEEGLNARGQAAFLADRTDGVLLPATDAGRGGDPNAIVGAIVDGVRRIRVTVTPSAGTCDPGLSVTFDPPGPTTVVGGTVVRYRLTATVAAGATRGATLRCTVEYRLSPAGGTLTVPVVVHVADPALPLVVVDDVTVNAAGPEGAVVTYTASAVDPSGRSLTPACAPPSGSTFPIGQTLVTCTATDSSGRRGADTALISVVEPAASTTPRIWVVTLTFPAPGTLVVTEQVVLGTSCPGTPDDAGPAWSPDGQRLAFTRAGVLCVRDAAGTRTPLVPPVGRPGFVADPAWSPDGALIAFTWDSSIWTMPASGGSPTVVIEAPGGATQPTFRPLPPTGLTVRITATPQPAYVGGAPIVVTVTAQNTARVPATRAFLVVEVPAALAGQPAPVLLGAIPPGGSAVVTVSLPAARAVVDVARAALTGQFPGDRAETVRAETPIVVIAPALKVDPFVGPPGFVPMATGTGFPPGTVVRLTWSRGISARLEVRAGPDGTFRQQVLVFHHDQLGDRRLVAAGPGFAPVDAPFRVVPATLDPRDFVERR